MRRARLRPLGTGRPGKPLIGPFGEVLPEQSPVPASFAQYCIKPSYAAHTASRCRNVIAKSAHRLASLIVEVLDKGLARPASPWKSALVSCSDRAARRQFCSCSVFESSLPFDVASGTDVRTCFWEHREHDVRVEDSRDGFTSVPKTSSGGRYAEVSSLVRVYNRHSYGGAAVIPAARAGVAVTLLTVCARSH